MYKHKQRRRERRDTRERARARQCGTARARYLFARGLGLSLAVLASENISVCSGSGLSDTPTTLYFPISGGHRGDFSPRRIRITPHKNMLKYSEIQSLGIFSPIIRPIMIPITRISMIKNII